MHKRASTPASESLPQTQCYDGVRSQEPVVLQEGESTQEFHGEPKTISKVTFHDQGQFQEPKAKDIFIEYPKKRQFLESNFLQERAQGQPPYRNISNQEPSGCEVGTIQESVLCDRQAVQDPVLVYQGESLQESSVLSGKETYQEQFEVVFQEPLSKANEPPQYKMDISQEPMEEEKDPQESFYEGKQFQESLELQQITLEEAQQLFKDGNVISVVSQGDVSRQELVTLQDGKFQELVTYQEDTQDSCGESADVCPEEEMDPGKTPFTGKNMYYINLFLES